jgi:predicted NACHT family NTPase
MCKDDSKQTSDGNNRRKHVLVSGGPGFGKTTLCQYIAHEWSSGLLFQEIKCLFYIKLRNLALAETSTLKKIVQSECFFTEDLSADDKRKLDQILHDDKSILWLLDGYDEHRVKHSEDNALFQKCNLIRF